MATADENRSLSHDVANVLLAQIKRSGSETTVASHLKDLAEAYSIVTAAMPNPPARGRSVTSI